MRDGNDVNYVVDYLTNRYDNVGSNSLTYDEAGNLIIGKDGYGYKYDYENRILKITKDPNDTAAAEFAYDSDGKSDSDDPYLFTGRRVDILNCGVSEFCFDLEREISFGGLSDEG